jgi:Cu+-exporting ATPase
MIDTEATAKALGRLGDSSSTIETTSPRGGLTMAKDPVCHMDVDPKKAAAQSSYKGEVIYFCATGCKTKFDAAPGRYLPASK